MSRINERPVVDLAGYPIVAGLPQKAALASGTDAYQAVLTAGRTCHSLRFTLEPGAGAVLSLDGGATEHVRVYGNQVETVAGLVIPAGAAVKAKNSVAGSNHGVLTVEVW